MVSSSKTFTKKISNNEKTLLKELRALKKLPQNNENKQLLQLKKEELLSLDRTINVPDEEGPTLIFKLFDGKIYSYVGSRTQLQDLNVVGVYWKVDGDNTWEPFIISTQLTELQADELFGSTGLYAIHCEFYQNNFEANDYSDQFPEFGEDIFQLLGIDNNKGYFRGSGSGDPVFVTPEEIINGQDVIIIRDGGTDDFNDSSIAGRISWNSNSTTETPETPETPASNINETPAWAWVAVVLCVLFFIAALVKQGSRP